MNNHRDGGAPDIVSREVKAEGGGVGAKLTDEHSDYDTVVSLMPILAWNCNRNMLLFDYNR